MNRKTAMQYIGGAVDDTGAEREYSDIPANARLVGWQCGFEPMFVAVWSYLPSITLDACEAEELAADLLIERQWFAGEPTAADYVI